VILDLRLTLRRAHRRPWPVLALMALLGVAVGVNTAVFSKVNDVILADLPYPQPQQLVRVWAGQRTEGSAGQLTASDYNALAQLPGSPLAHVAAYRPAEFAVTSPKRERLVGAFVTPSIFDVLDLPLKCTTTAALRSRLSTERLVLLREGYARASFAAFQCGAETYVTIDSQPYLIAGLVPDALRVPDQDADLLVLFQPEEQRIFSGSAFSYTVRPVSGIARLRPGIPPQAADTLVAGAVALPGDRRIHLMSLRQQQTQRVAESVLLLQVLAGFVLLVTVVNAIQLLTARAAQQVAEGGIRAALGASGWQIHRPIVLEAGLVTAIGGAAALWVHHSVVTFLDRFGPTVGFHELAPGPDSRVWVVGLVATMIAGIVPAASVIVRSRLRPTAPQDWVSGGSERLGLRPRDVRVSQVLMAGQVAATTGGMVVGVFLVQSTLNLLAVRLGFDPGDVRAAAVYATAPDLETRARELMGLLEAGAATGVTSVAIASAIPMTTAQSMTVGVEGGSAGRVVTDRVFVSSGFFDLLALHVLEGRPFRPGDDRGADPVVVVSESFSRRFLSGSALGSRVIIANEPWTVIGVASDVRTRGVRQPMVPTIYIHLPQAPRAIGRAGHDTALTRAEFLISSRIAGSGDPLRPVRQLVDGPASSLSFGPWRPVAAAVDLNTRPTRFLTWVVVVFALLTSALGVVATAVAAQQHVLLRRIELAVRIALGASPTAARRLMSTACLMPAGFGIALGVPLGFVSSGLLRVHLFGIEPSSVVPYLLAGLTVGLGCVSAMAVPIYKAGRISPSEALRTL
jgi:putative ABC transport system permease protein